MLATRPACPQAFISRIKDLKRSISFLFRWRKFSLGLNPERDLSASSTTFTVIGIRPCFRVTTPSRRLPTGLCLFSYTGGSIQSPMSPWLSVDDGGGWQGSRYPLPTCYGELVEGFVKLPEKVQALRFMPGYPRDAFHISHIEALELGQVGAFWHFIRNWMDAEPLSLGRFSRAMRRGYLIWRQGGLIALKTRMLGLGRWSPDYANWIAHYDRLNPTDIADIQHRIEALPVKPSLSVVMPTYNTPAPWLIQAIESVLSQLYPNWELCIADDASSNPLVRGILERYQQRDPRIKIVFRKENGHISAASNSALRLSTGEFVALLDHDDLLAPHALYLIAEYLNQHPEADVLYSDEDKITQDGERFDPYFKPDFNEALLLSHNMVCHFGVYRRSRIDEIGGFRLGYEGSQDYDLLLRILLKTTTDKIVHIPFVLYHWRAIPGSTALALEEKDYADQAARKALNDYLELTEPGCRVVPGSHPGTHRVVPHLPEPPPKVSLIILADESSMTLDQCIASLMKRTNYPNYEILQALPGRKFLAAKKTRFGSLVRTVECDASNLAAVANHAARHAVGNLLCFLRPGIEVISEDWLQVMTAHALRQKIGAVGAKLIYPDGSLQDGGLVLGMDGILAGSAYQGLPVKSLTLVPRYYSAVSGACLVVRRELFHEVDGFDADTLANHFFFTDFCLKLRELGYSNFWTPDATLIYHENNDGYEVGAGLLEESHSFIEKWRESMDNDQCYNPNLSLESASFRYAKPRVDPPWRL